MLHHVNDPHAKTVLCVNLDRTAFSDKYIYVHHL